MEKNTIILPLKTYKKPGLINVPLQYNYDTTYNSTTGGHGLYSTQQ
jgi:hypothetical protein